MDEISARTEGQIAALTLVVRQILDRIPQSEQDEMRSFVSARLLGIGGAGEEIEAVKAAAGETLKALFTAATPEKR